MRKGLPEGMPRKPRLKDPAGAMQGTEFLAGGRDLGYRGPMPPPGHGTHHYYFKLYALKDAIGVEPGLDKKTLLEKMQGHVLGRGRTDRHVREKMRHGALCPCPDHRKHRGPHPEDARLFAAELWPHLAARRRPTSAGCSAAAIRTLGP